MFSQIHYLRSDIARRFHSDLRGIFYNFFDGGFWAVVFYRFGRCLFLFKVPVLKYFLRLVSFFVFKLSEIFFSVSLPPSVDIGPGLYIGHTGVLVFHYQVKAGSNFSVSHGVTIGTAALGKKGVPKIGNNVYIGSGAKVLGNIKIGNNCHIGANAVVVKDLPDNCTAVGVPARIVRRLMSEPVNELTSLENS